MSYYLFKAKRNIRVGDSIFPLVLYADSSVRDWNGTRNYHWSFRNISEENGLLIPRDILEKARKDILEEQIQYLKDFQEKFPNLTTDGEITMETKTYSGNSYPGGRKLKNMDAFNSIRKTYSVEEIIKENYGPFEVGFWKYDKSTYTDVGEKSYFVIREDADLIRADAEYRKFYEDLVAERKYGHVIDVRWLCVK